MKSEIIARKECILPEEKHRLIYMLLRRSYRGRPLYSLSVSELGTSKESFVLLPDLTDEHREAMHLFSLFAKETVTPCTAEDVLVELLYEG